jgi:hypothetical protein
MLPRSALSFATVLVAATAVGALAASSAHGVTMPDGRQYDMAGCTGHREVIQVQTVAAGYG